MWSVWDLNLWSLDHHPWTCDPLITTDCAMEAGSSKYENDILTIYCNDLQSKQITRFMSCSVDIIKTPVQLWVSVIEVPVILNRKVQYGKILKNIRDGVPGLSACKFITLKKTCFIYKDHPLYPHLYINTNFQIS